MGEGIHYSQLDKGTKLEVEVSKAKAELRLETEVIDHVAEGIIVEKITVNNSLVGFTDDLKVKVYFNYNQKLYEWNEVAVKAVRYQKNIRHLIMVNGEAQVANRRKAYRLYIGEDMLVININKLSKDQEPERVLVRDVSETGYAFLTKTPMELGDKVRLRLPLASKYLDLDATIVRIEPKEELGKVLYGAKLLHTHPQLNSYIVQRQRERMQSKNRSSSKQS